MAVDEPSLVEFVPGDDASRPRVPGPDRSAGPIDVVAARPAGSRSAAWLCSGGAAADRALAGCAAALMVAAVAVVVAALARRPVTRVVSNTVIDPPPAVGVDALGCPLGRHCRVREPRGTEARVLSWQPGLAVVAASETVDVRTGQAYRRELVASAVSTGGRVTEHLRLFSQCVPGSQPPRRPERGVRYATAAGRVFGVARVQGRDGCVTVLQFAMPGRTPPRDVEAIIEAPAVRVRA